MADTVKYLVTVDAATGETLRIEEMGGAGELTEVPLDAFAPAEAGAAPQYVLNVYMGGEGGPGYGVTLAEASPRSEAKRRGIPHQPGPSSQRRGIPHQPGPAPGRVDLAAEGEDPEESS